MSTTRIEWTDYVVNPFPGCRKCSPGCLNCYAERMAKRLKAMGHPAYQDVVDEKGWTGEIGCQYRRTPKWPSPMRKIPGKRKRVFCQSMGDLFYDGVTDGQILDVLRWMRRYDEHTYLILTKRIARAGKLFAPSVQERWYLWPLPHVWLGVSVSNGDELHKIATLRQTPAAWRFVSFEPLLAPFPATTLQGIDWVVIGCETGPSARPCAVEWVANLATQCIQAGVPVFVKAIRVKGKIIRDLNIISCMLGLPADKLRQMP